jgi:hypothetical protein
VSVPPLPMPDPWRAFLQNYPEIGTQTPAYERLKQSYLDRRDREIPAELLQSWDGDQGTGRVKLLMADDQWYPAQFQIIASHDGKDFMWADANPSIVDKTGATRARAAIASLFPTLARADRLNISRRDTAALTLLAGRELSVERTLTTVGGSSISMFLTGLPADFGQAPSPKKPSFLGGLFGKPKSQEPASVGGLFAHLDHLLADQLAQVTLDIDALCNLEPDLVAIKEAYDQGDYTIAQTLIAVVKAKMGEYYYDQEPTGWLLYCEGACQLAEGKKDEAAKSFSRALGTIEVPHPELTRLGLARASDDPADVRSYLSAIAISDPAWLASNASPHEKSIADAHMVAVQATRDHVGDDVDSVIRASLIDRYAQEVGASELDDSMARNRAYRDLLLKWFTPGRSPSMSSYSSDPDENIDRLKSLEILNCDDATAQVRVFFTNEGRSDDQYQYDLLKVLVPATGQTRWFIDKVWSIWDDEDIRLH